jgi:hypothetical protein
MSRSTSQQPTRVALKTNQGQPTGLGVFQSLNVQAAAPKSAQIAQGLADALSVVTETTPGIIERRAEAGAKRGIADATLGRIDNEKLKRDLGYQDGVETITSKQAIFTARAAWQTHYSEDVDKTLPAEEIARHYDEFMKGQLADTLQRNPKIISKMAGEYMRGMQETIVGHQQQLTAQHMQLANNVLQQEVIDDPSNFLLHVQDHVKLTGDMDKSIAAGIDALGIEAVRTGNPELLKAISLGLTADDGTQSDNPDFNSDHRAAIERYIEASTAAYLKNHSVERALAKSDAEKGWKDSLAAGIPIPWENLMGQLKGEHPLFSQDEVMSYYGQNMALEEALKDHLAFDGLDPTVPFYMQQGKLDAAGKEITKERITRQVNRMVEATYQRISGADPEMSKAYAMARAAVLTTATEAYPYEPLKSTFDNVPLEDVQTFANVADAYAELPITQRAKYVTDPKRRADFETYLQRRDIIGDKAAVEEIATRDPELSEKRIGEYRREINETSEKVGGQLLQGANWNPFGDDDVHIDDLVDSTYAKRVITENTQIRMGRGSASIESARKGALEDFKATHMIVPTDKGYRTIPRVAGVTERFGAAVDWAEQNMQVTAEKLGYKGALPVGFRLVFDPMSRDNAAMIVTDEDGMPVSPGVLRFSPQKLEAIYREKNPGGVWKGIEASSEIQRRLHEKLDEWPEYQKKNPTLPFSRVHD